MGFEHYTTDDFETVHPAEGRDWDQWVSASRTRNWCKRNPLQDWLVRDGEAAGFERDPEPDPRTDFREFIFAKGHAFEAAVVALISERTSVFTIGGFERPAQSLDACWQTFDAMVRGEGTHRPGCLVEPQNRTYGAADLLVRSDVLRTLFPDALSEQQARLSAPGIGLDGCHYRVIDIKFTTLSLDKHWNAGLEHLPYMAQTFVYNEALGRIQGYVGVVTVVNRCCFRFTVHGEPFDATARWEAVFDIQGRSVSLIYVLREPHRYPCATHPARLVRTNSSNCSGWAVGTGPRSAGRVFQQAPERQRRVAYAGT